MITIITYISTKQGFKNLKRSVINLEYDYKIGLNILCIVGQSDLYVQCRNWLQENVNTMNCLTVFYEGDNPLEQGKEYLSFEDQFVYLSNQNLVIPAKGITTLHQDYLLTPTAGFISGLFAEYPTVCWVDDIYNDNPERYRWGDKQIDKTLVEVDTVYPTGLLTKSSIYKDLFCKTKLENYDNLSYGIRLRRQGYKNYLDTRVRLEYGEKR